MRTDDAPEIIEIIDDDADPFGERAPSHTMHDTRGPRWIGPAAAIALVAIIGYGIATSASGTGAPNAAPVTSTATPTTTRSEPAPIVEPPSPVPYYAAAPPPGYSLSYAQVFTTGLVDDTPGAYELWATPDASASSGSWFAITTTPGGDGLRTNNARRQMMAGRSVAVSRPTAAHTVIHVAIDQEFGVMITSFGWSDEQLARLVGSLTITSRDFIGFSDGWFSADHQLVSRVPMRSATWGVTTNEQVYYTPDTHPLDGISIGVATPPSDSFAGPAPNRDQAIRFTLDHRVPFEVDGHPAVAGDIVGWENHAMATWIDDGRIITASGALPVEQLMSFARTVRRVGDSEWKDMKTQAAKANDSTFVEGTRNSVAKGTDGDGKTWTITAALRTEGKLHLVEWGWDRDAWPTFIDESPRVKTLVTEDRTYVFAVVPRTVAAAANLTVVRDGFDPAAVSFVDVEPTADWILAAYTFSEPVPFTAAITDMNGTTLDTWPRR
jgi:hypothetical protein